LQQRDAFGRDGVADDYFHIKIKMDEESSLPRRLGQTTNPTFSPHKIHCAPEKFRLCSRQDEQAAVD
jgi:hypothetical protein